MTDIVDKATRSRIMSRIKGAGSKIEMKVGRAVFSRGFRYRKNDPKLPGKPDLYFPKFNAVIFIHGCFWHRHGCKLTYSVKSRKSFWEEKFRKTQNRDQRVLEELGVLGVRTCVLWECYVLEKSSASIGKSLETWLTSDRQKLVLPEQKNE